MVLKLSKKVQFLQFCAVLSKKPEFVKTTCIYASESSHYTLSENDMVYRGLRGNQNTKKYANSALI